MPCKFSVESMSLSVPSQSNRQHIWMHVCWDRSPHTGHETPCRQGACKSPHILQYHKAPFYYAVSKQSHCEWILLHRYEKVQMPTSSADGISFLAPAYMYTCSDLPGRLQAPKHQQCKWSHLPRHPEGPMEPCTDPQNSAAQLTGPAGIP